MPFVVVKGLRLAYDSFGDGPPLLFLSGLGGDRRGHASSLRHFSGRFRALGLDNRDSGESDKATGPYSIAELADDVATWAKALGLGPLHVVGHSMGGLVAQALASDRPELVASVVLASTHRGGSPWRRALVASWSLLRARTGPEEFMRATLPYLVARSYYDDPARPEGLVRYAERTPNPQGPEAFARQAEAVIGFDGVDLSRIKAPALVLVGAEDLVNPPETAKALADSLTNAELRVLPGVGHLPHVEDGAGFRAAIGEFLDRVV